MGSIAKGAGLGAFGATLIGGGYFALKGIYDGVQVWRNPNATAFQKVLGSANVLIGVASAFALKGQVRSQVDEWLRVYSRIPLKAQVQTNTGAIRRAFDGGKTHIKFGNVTVRFSRDAPNGVMGMSGSLFGGVGDEIILTQHALGSSDDQLMKTIIEENLHNFRSNSTGIGGTTGLSTSIIEGEEAWADTMTEQIFAIGRQRSWW